MPEKNSLKMHSTATPSKPSLRISSTVIVTVIKKPDLYLTRLIQTLNLHLDTSRLRIRRRLERLDRILELEPMRNQLLEVNDTALVQPDGLGPSIAVAVLELEVDLTSGEAHKRDFDFVFANADDEDFAAKLDGLDGCVDGAFDTGAFHGVRGLDAIGQLEDGGLEVFGGVAELDFVCEDVGDEFFGKVQPALVNVGDDEGRGTSRLTAEESDEADGTGTADDDGVAETYVGAVHTGERNTEGLKHGTVFEAHAVGKLVAPHGWVLEVAAQQAGNGRGRQEKHSLTTVVATGKAGLALAADDVGLDGYAVAGLEVRY